MPTTSWTPPSRRRQTGPTQPRSRATDRPAPTPPGPSRQVCRADRGRADAAGPRSVAGPRCRWRVVWCQQAHAGKDPANDRCTPGVQRHPWSAERDIRSRHMKSCITAVPVILFEHTISTMTRPSGGGTMTDQQPTPRHATHRLGDAGRCPRHRRITAGIDPDRPHRDDRCRPGRRGRGVGESTVPARRHPDAATFGVGGAVRRRRPDAAGRRTGPEELHHQGRRPRTGRALRPRWPPRRWRPKRSPPHCGSPARPRATGSPKPTG